MKKNTVTLMLLAAIGFGGLTAKAQNAEERANIAKLYDTNAEREFTNRIVSESEAKYKRAIELAKANNWPLRIEDKATGRISVLTGLRPDNTPIYKSSDTNVKVAETARVIEARNELLLSLDGEDMIIGMWEIAAARGTHSDLTGRVISKDGVVFQGNNEETGHATHVAGTMIGSGTGNASAIGLAYNASELWAHDAFNDDAEALIRAQQGLLISNHSYGVPIENAQEWERGAYNQEAYDWDLVTSARPYYQPVISAGNDGATANRDLLVGNKNSKNVITVAATAYVQNYVNNNSVSIAGFSSPGPTDDYRVKPDISGQGVDVLSCWSANNNDYNTISGTSMAAPGVAASLALMQQHYRSFNNGAAVPFMKAATLRALMIHTADEAGQFPGPDFRYGWGLINTRKAVELITKKYDDNSAIIDELVLNPGEEYTRTVVVTGDKPLRATIAWTDPTNVSLIRTNSSNGNNNNNPVLVNNLDLKVTRVDNNTDYLPWKLNTNNLAAAAVKGVNNVDNVEVVDASAAPGTYVITVTGDLPNFEAQDFALIVDGVEGGLGVADNFNNNGLKIYPNPANNYINISMNDNGDKSGYKIQMYDIQGRIVKYSDKFIDTINTSDLASGLYLVNIIKKDGSTISKKVVIK